MDEVVTQLGLLLTQTRFARRALEDIERATARYGSFAVTAAVASAGGGIAAPPMVDGALRVHVVNISDLAPGSGDTLSGLLGGIGSFVGNLVGGAVGGTVGSITLAASLNTINTLVGRIERIITKLGLGQTPAQPAAGAAEAAAKSTGAAGTAGAATAPAAGTKLEFLALLESLQGKFTAATALLQAANGTPPGPPGSPGGAGSNPLNAPDAAGYRAWLDSLTTALEAATRLVGGLIFAVPTAIAGLSWLLDRLPDLRNAITETLQFIVRNVLVLRGAVLVLAFETIAMVARVAAMAVRTLAATVNEALAALFAALAKLLDAALELGGVLGTAITKTINQLLSWLVPTVYEVLWKLGELRLFRVIERLINAASDLSRTISQIWPDKEKSDAAGKSGPQETVQLPKPPEPPDLGAIMKKAAADAKTATDKLTGASKELVDKPTTALRKGLSDFGKSLDEAAIKEAGLSGTKLAEQLTSIGEKSKTAAEALLPKTTDTGKDNVWDRLRSQTPFHPIAAAYGQWLATGGLAQLLDSMSTYFAAPSARSDNPATPAVEATAVVEIDEVVIDITPAAAPAPAPEVYESPWGPGEYPMTRGSDLERIERQRRLDERRGIRGQRRPHVPIFDFTY